MMKKFLWWLLLVLVLGFIGLLIYNTFQLESKQIEVDEQAAYFAINDQLAAQRLAGALPFQTISHQDPTQVDSSAFLGLHAYLAEHFPLVDSVLTRETVADLSLLYTWPGTNPDLQPALLLSHLDVVPISPGTEADWAHDPFAGMMADGYVWGRGAMDDKVSVLGLLEAVEYLLSIQFQPERTYYLAFGHDEEIGGTAGAGEIAKMLSERGLSFDYVLDEGGLITTGSMMGMDSNVAAIGIAEKGYVSLELTVEGEGGHSSTPPRRTTIGLLSRAIHRLQENPFPAKLEGATEEMLAYLGADMPFMTRLALANRWLLNPLIERQLGNSPTTNAMVRTTTAPTIIEAGVKENVLPIQARAVVNFRILPGETADGVEARVRDIVDDERVLIQKLGFYTEPSRVSSTQAPTFQLLQRTVAIMYPGTLVAPYQLSGGTDTKHYTDLAENLYRFIPIIIGGDDFAGFHGTNERVSIEAYGNMVRFYCQFLTQDAKAS